MIMVVVTVTVVLLPKIIISIMVCRGWSLDRFGRVPCLNELGNVELNLLARNVRQSTSRHRIAHPPSLFHQTTLAP